MEEKCCLISTSKTVFLGQPLVAVVIELVQEVKTSEQHKDHHHSLFGLSATSCKVVIGTTYHTYRHHRRQPLSDQHLPCPLANVNN